MVDYKKMYCILCAAASEALDRLPDSIENMMGRKLLQDALLKAEDEYVSSVENTGES